MEACRRASTRSPGSCRLNLGREVPVIIHRDNIISDYDQIIDYVERTFAGGVDGCAGPDSARKLGKPGNPPPTPDPGLVSPRQGTTGYRPGSDTPPGSSDLRGPPLGVLGL